MPMNMDNSPPLSLGELQRLIETMYSSKDTARGVDGTFMWLMEEVGELAAALREGDRSATAAEFAAVLAGLAVMLIVMPLNALMARVQQRMQRKLVAAAGASLPIL